MAATEQEVLTNIETVKTTLATISRKLDAQPPVTNLEAINAGVTELQTQAQAISDRLPETTNV